LPSLLRFLKAYQYFQFSITIGKPAFKAILPFSFLNFFVYLPKHIFIRLLPILFKVNLHLFSITKSLIFLLNLIKSY